MSEQSFLPPTPLFLVPGFDIRLADEEERTRYVRELENLREVLLRSLGTTQDEITTNAHVANQIAYALQAVPGNVYRG